MEASIRLPYQLHSQMITLAARRSASVESVLASAIATYIADCDSGLLLGPRETPRYDAHARHSPVERLRRR